MLPFSPGGIDFHNLMRHYSSLIAHDVSEYESNFTNLCLPIVPERILQNLCKTAMYYFQREPMVVKLNSSAIIVGDLHGHILDLFRILKKFGLPPNQTYVFLGDIIDRGEFSLETITLIFTMKVLYPQNTIVVRGNHEFKELCQTCGFVCELAQVYKSTEALEKCFYDAFSYIPLAALIHEKILCIHGGIGPTVKTIRDIQMIQRPLLSFSYEPAGSLLWSDPTTKVDEFVESDRGTGYKYGQTALFNFIANNNLDIIVRGHECVDGGVNLMFQRRLVTVFSASNYCGVQPNKAAVLTVSLNGMKKEAVVFLPLKYMPRPKAVFLRSEKENAFVISQATIDAASPKRLLPSIPSAKCHSAVPQKSHFQRTPQKKTCESSIKKDRSVGLPMDTRAFSGILLTKKTENQLFISREKSVRKLNARRTSLK